MAESTIMSELQIYILLLFVMSFSASVLSYALYVEYKRSQYVNYIKDVISLQDDETQTLLQEKVLPKNNHSLLYRLDALMVLAGFKFPSYVFVSLVITFVLISGSVFSLFLKHWSGYAIGIPFGMIIFSMIINSIISSRKKRFNRSLSVSISVLVKMMKNGIGFEQALLKSVAVSGSELFKKQFY